MCMSRTIVFLVNLAIKFAITGNKNKKLIANKRVAANDAKLAAKKAA